MRDRFEALQEEYQWCDYIGEFFENPLVKRAYGELWNEIQAEDWSQIIPKRFDIFNVEHLSFIRTVFEDTQLSERFLQILRTTTLKFQTPEGFIYENKQILSFLIIWQDIQDRCLNYSETLPRIFQEKIINIVSSVGSNTVYEDPKDENNYISFAEGIGNLLKSWFTPIDAQGNLIFGFPTIPQIFDFYDVVNAQWEKYTINKDWEKIDEEEIERISKENLEKLKESYEKAKTYLEWGNSWSNAPEDILPTLAYIVSTQLTGFEDSQTVNQLLLTGINSMISSAQDAIKKRNRERMRGVIKSV